jgi:hypothetical protein
VNERWPCPSCKGTLSVSCGTCDQKGAVQVYSIARHEALMAAAKEAVEAHDVIISNGGTGWNRHIAEPLWKLRAALRAAGIDTEGKT